MKPRIILLISIACHLSHPLSATDAQVASSSDRRLIIDPSSMGIPIGKASLTVSPLDYRQQAYVGDYELKVSPLSFFSERGTLKFDAPDESIHKLAQGQPVDFHGKATNTGGHTSAVTGKMIPQRKGRGTVMFTIFTAIGRIEAKTSYRLSD